MKFANPDRDLDYFQHRVLDNPIDVTTDAVKFRRQVAELLTESEIEFSTAQLTKFVAALSERDDDAPVVKGPKGVTLPDPKLRDTENVPWSEDIHEYFAREVAPFAPDAWIDESKTKEGCEIPFTRHFYEYVPPRPLDEIDRDLDAVLGRIRTRLEQVRA